MVGLDVLHQAQDRGKHTRLNHSLINEIKERMRMPLTGYLEKWGILAATPTTSATHRSPHIGGSVHDELVVKALEDKVEEAKHWLVSVMPDGIAAFLQEVPVPIETQVKESWDRRKSQC